MQGGTALLAFIAVICVHSMLLLVKAKQYTCDSEGITRLSYGGLVRVLSCTVCARVLVQPRVLPCHRRRAP